MTGEERGKPSQPGKKARAERLAAALRANLKRRKAQARGRASGDAEISERKTRP
jgi:hypothetical protein